MSCLDMSTMLKTKPTKKDWWPVFIPTTFLIFLRMHSRTSQIQIPDRGMLLSPECQWVQCQLDIFLNTVVSEELVAVWCTPRCFEQTFVANATVVVRPFTVFLEVVRHVGSSQKLATNLAGDFVLVTCEMWPEAISCSKRGITNLKHGDQYIRTSLACLKAMISYWLSSSGSALTGRSLNVTWHLWGLSVVWTCLICPFRWSGLEWKKKRKIFHCFVKLINDWSSWFFTVWSI